MQHRSPPHDGLVLIHEEAHRDAPHAIGHRRHEKVTEQGGRTIDPQHGRDREAVDVRIEDRHRGALPRQRDREVDGDRRLADATLARGNGDHPSTRSLVGKGVRSRSRPVGAVSAALGMRTRMSACSSSSVLPPSLPAAAAGTRPSSSSLARSSVSSASLMIDEVDLRGGTAGGGDRLGDLVRQLARRRVPGGGHGEHDFGTATLTADQTGACRGRRGCGTGRGRRPRGQHPRDDDREPSSACPGSGHGTSFVEFALVPTLGRPPVR